MRARLPRLPSGVTSTPPISRADVGLRSERGPILLAVMLGIGLVAIDATVLATAVPAVVEDLGGFTQFPWLFSIYLLTQAATVPLYSKLADQYGRKPMMLRRGQRLPPRLAPVRAGLEHDGADRVPRRAGHRRRGGPADRHDHRRGHLLRRGAGQGAGLPRRGLGALRRHRPGAGRALLRLHVLALDLLRQPAYRCRGALGVLAQVRGAGRAEAAPARRARRAAPHRRRRDAPPRAARGRGRAGSGRRRPASACSCAPPPCCRRSSWSNGGPPSRCSRCGCSGTG